MHQNPIYRRRRFEAEIIELCVRWYITYRLSDRDLVALMAERGLEVSHTTILPWVSTVCSGPIWALRPHRHSHARHWPPACRGGRARSRAMGMSRVIRHCGD